MEENPGRMRRGYIGDIETPQKTTPPEANRNLDTGQGRQGGGGRHSWGTAEDAGKRHRPHKRAVEASEWRLAGEALCIGRVVGEWVQHKYRGLQL